MSHYLFLPYFDCALMYNCSAELPQMPSKVLKPWTNCCFLHLLQLMVQLLQLKLNPMWTCWAVTSIHRRQRLHWLLFLLESNKPILLYLIKMLLFFLTCSRMVTMPPLILQILLLLVLVRNPTHLPNFNSSNLTHLPNFNSNNRQMFTHHKVDIIQMGMSRTWVRLIMSNRCTCRGLVLPGMVKFLSSTNNSSPLHLAMVLLSHVAFTLALH